MQNSIFFDDVLYFLSKSNSIKLFHFTTSSYSAHKASDQFYTDFNNLLDKFWEVYQGRYGKLTIDNKINPVELPIKIWNSNNIKSELDEFINYLYNSKLIKGLNDSELLNIRDELVETINQFKYLLTFN